MIFLIDGRRQPEHHFWNCLHNIASERQKYRLLDGFVVRVGERKYQILFDKN